MQPRERTDLTTARPTGGGAAVLADPGSLAAVDRCDRGRYGAGMLADYAIVPFVATLDLARSHAFYGDVLGLTRVEATPFANVYDALGTELRITLAQAMTPATHTVLGWNVSDIRATIDQLRAGGVTFVQYDQFGQDHDEVWTAPGGTQVAWFHDPDRNVLSVQQPA